MREYFTNELEFLEGGLASPGRFLQIARLEGLRSLALVGLSKNAGKTTCLNHLIRAWQQAGNPRPLALTSIGRDGEKEDVLNGQPKPRIYIHSGTYLATAESSLSRCDALLDILALSGIRTNFGEVVICKALSDGYVELAGPSQASDLLECERILRAQDPALFFVVDGALSRRAQAGGGLTQALILAVGAETSANPEELAEITAHALTLLSVPALEPKSAERVRRLLESEPDLRVIAIPKADDTSAKTLILPSLVGQAKAIAKVFDGNLNTLMLRGAFTDSVCKHLLSEKRFQNLTLVVEDGTRLFISPAMLRKLNRQSVQLAALFPLSVRLVCLNPYKADGSPADRLALLKALRALTPIPVEDFGPTPV
jgi:hypothetical protein